MADFSKAYDALRDLCKDDLPALKHVVAIKQAYETNKNFDKQAELSLQLVLNRLQSFNPEAAAMLGTQAWEPNVVAWAEFLDGLTPERGLGEFLGISDEKAIPKGPSPNLPGLPAGEPGAEEEIEAPGETEAPEEPGEITPGGVARPIPSAIESVIAEVESLLTEYAATVTKASYPREETPALATTEHPSRQRSIIMHAAQIAGDKNDIAQLAHLIRKYPSMRSRLIQAFGMARKNAREQQRESFKSTYHHMKPEQILKIAESAKDALSIVRSLCEDMAFSEGQSVYVGSGLGRTSLCGTYMGLANGGYAKVKDLHGVIHTVLPHMLFPR